MVNWTEEAKALAMLAQELLLMMIEQIAQPDIRQMQAMHLINEARQDLYGASTNLQPDGEQIDEDDHD